MNALVIFAKYPEPGKVKKHIGVEIGMDRSAELCRAFINDLIAENSEKDYDVYLSFIGHEYKEDYREMFPQAILYVQRGQNMTTNVQFSFEDLLDDYEKVALIGSDVPDLKSEMIVKAFNALDKHDVVLGPSEDGGYYLVALKKPHDIFQGLPWGKQDLLDVQTEILDKQHLTFALLEKLPDVDDIEELKALKKRLKREDAPATYDFVQTLDI
jgi:uncharacterized protein